MPKKLKSQKKKAGKPQRIVYTIEYSRDDSETGHSVTVQAKLTSREAAKARVFLERAADFGIIDEEPSVRPAATPYGSLASLMEFLTEECGFNYFFSDVNDLEAELEINK